MPHSPDQWAWFTFYTLGSIGGVCFLGYLVVLTIDALITSKS